MRGVGEATLGLIGGTAELVAAGGSEWFSAGLSTPVSAALAVDEQHDGDLHPLS